jgi:quinolinate synthase
MNRQTPFPSLLVTAERLEAQGALAVAQRAVLDPDPDTVTLLQQLLETTQTGVVAHYYMAPEIQGALLACNWPHIHISDSLVMADRAVQMVAAGAKAILVLGVDFMSENARSLLDASGYRDVPVWRAASAAISCSLAEAAETPAYLSYLGKAAQTPRSVHVIYVNTSLKTKAQAEAQLPTITCTSSNVVSTILQCFAQIPESHVWFGPDTYMGRNVARLLEQLVQRGDAAIRAIQPELGAAQLARALNRFHYFEAGNCIVHHLFGDEVASRVKADYADALITAHLEVPGAMFGLALQAQATGRGVAGSTSDILRFVERRVSEALGSDLPQRIRVVLGTEVGLVASLVHQLQRQLAAHRERDVSVEVIFPVASEAVFVSDDQRLPVIPGAASSEGCSLEGGCATCPYMKMNHLDAMLDVLTAIATKNQGRLSGFEAQRPIASAASGSSLDLALRPILAMRHFSKTRTLPEALVQRALAPARASAPAVIT